MAGTTQAQIDALKTWYSQGSALVNALTPCPLPPADELFTQYNQAYLGNHTYYSRNLDAAGNPVGGESVACVVDQSAPNAGRIIWGATGERNQLITSPTGEAWCVCLGFEDMAYGYFYALETVRQDWGPYPGGPYRDVTNIYAAPGAQGGQAVIQVLPATGLYRNRCWMYTHNNDGSRSGPCYLEQRLTFGTSVLNKAWIADANRLRKAIKYQEVWWDTSGWTRGSAPTPPWVQTGGQWTMQEINPTFNGSDAFAKGAGILWQYVYPDYKTALTR